MHVCCSNDDFQYALQHIYFHEGKAIATEGHVLIIVPISEISTFPEEQIKLLEGKFLHFSQYKEILKYDFAEITDQGIVCKTFYNKNANMVMNEMKYPFIDGISYPSYKKILPNGINKIDAIALNIRLFNMISQACGIDAISMTFQSKGDPILIEFLHSEAIGVIMPAYLSED